MTECAVCGKYLPIDYVLGGRIEDWDIYILCGDCFYDLKEGRK